MRVGEDGKAPRAQLGREKPILLVCRSSVVRENVGGSGLEQREAAEHTLLLLLLPLGPAPRPCPSSATPAVPSSPHSTGRAQVYSLPLYQGLL